MRGATVIVTLGSVWHPASLHNQTVKGSIHTHHVFGQNGHKQHGKVGTVPSERYRTGGDTRVAKAAAH